MDYNPDCTAVIVVDMQRSFKEASEYAIDGVNDVLDATEDVTLTVFTRDARGKEFYEDIDGTPDRIIEKDTYDAFYETELARLLSVHGIDTVIICGMLTDGCVQETASSASLRGYDVSVVEDAVGYIDEEQRDPALEHIEFLIGELVSTEEL